MRSQRLRCDTKSLHSSIFEAEIWIARMCLVSHLSLCDLIQLREHNRFSLGESGQGLRSNRALPRIAAVLTLVRYRGTWDIEAIAVNAEYSEGCARSSTFRCRIMQ